MVMAYSGVERAIKALTDRDGMHGLDANAISHFVDACALGDFGEPILSPRRTKDAETHRALTSMRSVVRGFLEGQGVKTWADAIRLAQGLRNATVHGSLAAYRVSNGGLVPEFTRLTIVMVLVMSGAINRLSEPSSKL